MNGPLRIAVADDDHLMRLWYENTLAKLGHEVIGIARNGRELLRLIDDEAANKPDLVITDIEMPDIDGLTALEQLQEKSQLPIIVVSGHHQDDYVQRALRTHVLAYLVKPIKKPDLATAIAVVRERFSEFQMLRRQSRDLAQALEDRKLIERAKGIMMKRAGLDEHAAFERLQKLSQERNQKLVQIARTIVSAEEAFAL